MLNSAKTDASICPIFSPVCVPLKCRHAKAEDTIISVSGSTKCIVMPIYAFLCADHMSAVAETHGVPFRTYWNFSFSLVCMSCSRLLRVLWLGSTYFERTDAQNFLNPCRSTIANGCMSSTNMLTKCSSKSTCDTCFIGFEDDHSNTSVSIFCRLASAFCCVTFSSLHFFPVPAMTAFSASYFLNSSSWCSCN